MVFGCLLVSSANWKRTSKALHAYDMQSVPFFSNSWHFFRIMLHKSNLGGSQHRNAILPQHCVFSCTHGEGHYRILNIHNVWQAQVAISSLQLCLLDALLWPKAEIFIILRVYYLPLQNRLFVLLEKTALESPAPESSSSIISNLSFGRDICSWEDSTATQSATFLILVWKTWFAKPSDWRICISYSAVLRPHLFEIMAGNFSMSYRQSMSVVLAACLNQFSINCAFVLISCSCYRSGLVAGHCRWVLVCFWPALAFPALNGQESFPIFRSVLTRDEWGDVLEPTGRMQAPKHNNFLYGDLEFWQRSVNLWALQKISQHLST